MAYVAKISIDPHQPEPADSYETWKTRLNPDGSLGKSMERIERNISLLRPFLKNGEALVLKDRWRNPVLIREGNKPSMRYVGPANILIGRKFSRGRPLVHINEGITKVVWVDPVQRGYLSSLCYVTVGFPDDNQNNRKFITFPMHTTYWLGIGRREEVVFFRECSSSPVPYSCKPVLPECRSRLSRFLANLTGVARV